MVNLDVAAGRFVRRCTKRLGKKAAFGPKLVCIQRKKEKGKKQWDEDHKRISGARNVHESWEKIKCVYVFLGHALRSTSFFFGDANKSGISHFSFIFLTVFNIILFSFLPP